MTAGRGIPGIPKGVMDIVEAHHNHHRRYASRQTSADCIHPTDFTPGSYNVFISPYLSAEPACVARHMTEFTGLDIEMTFKDHYHEASVLFGEAFLNGIPTSCQQLQLRPTSGPLVRKVVI